MTAVVAERDADGHAGAGLCRLRRGFRARSRHVYVAATRYKLADYKPYLFRTTDCGETWQSHQQRRFPTGEITRVVRADPVRKGLLFAGTETGIFFTLDDGKSWMRMPVELPGRPGL